MRTRCGCGGRVSRRGETGWRTWTSTTCAAGAGDDLGGAPLLMTYFLVYVPGVRLTEKSMDGRPGFAEYRQRTACLFPRPPRPARR
ncbi:DUF1295 domain-containing protein [Mycobacterium genavense]|uniref:DUF1295 domain-containing protein n=1 Tax=Mycobacterium genavense TaxID=36812 RepID=UPI003CCBBBC6